MQPEETSLPGFQHLVALAIEELVVINHRSNVWCNFNCSPKMRSVIRTVEHKENLLASLPFPKSCLL